MTGTEDEDEVLTIFWVKKTPADLFDASFATWGRGSKIDVKSELAFFKKNPIRIQKKTMHVDSVAIKVAACLKAGMCVRMLEVTYNGPNIHDEKSRKTFKLKLVGTEVILEPVA